jgi:hypothetical protein
LEVGSEVAEECVHGGRGEVAETQDLADFAGCEEFFELLRVALESREVREAGREVGVPLRVCPVDVVSWMCEGEEVIGNLHLRGRG